MNRMRKKQVKFENLKVGQNFMYQRKLYVKDAEYCGTNIRTGMILSDNFLLSDTLVTPIKLDIRVL